MKQIINLLGARLGPEAIALHPNFLKDHFFLEQLLLFMIQTVLQLPKN